MPAKLGHIVDSSVVRGWRCDEASGALVDVAGGPNLPEYGGSGVVTASTGQVDGGRLFPNNVYGAQHFFSNIGAAVSADFTKMQTQRWTLAGWVNPSYPYWASDVSHVIAASGHGTDDSHRFQGLLYYLQVSGAATHELRGLYEINTAGGGTGSTNLAVFDSLWSLALSRWQYVCVVVDGVAGTATFYINGQKGNTVTGLAAPTQGYLSAFSFVGANPSHLYQQWVGALDEVFVWNRALSDAEVLENYHRAVGTPGYSAHRSQTVSSNVMRYWKFDEAPPTPGGRPTGVVDATGLANLPNNAMRTGGQVGGAVLFSYGTGDAPIVQATPVAADRNRMLPGNVSIACWVVLNTIGIAADGAYAWCTLAALSNPGSYFGALLRLAVHRTDWTLHYGYESGTPGGGTITEVTGPVVARDVPVHVAACRTGGTITLYMNGVLTHTFTGQPLPSGGVAGSVWVLGAYENGIYDRLWGTLDEVIVYDKCLSPAEVLSLYQDGIGYPLATTLPTTTRALPSTLPATDLLWNNVSSRFARSATGDLVLSRGVEAVRQDVQFALELIKGEYFLDTDEGTPWFDGILGKAKSVGAISTLLRNRIESRPYIHRVTSIELTQDVHNRLLTVTFSADTDFGDLTDQVVSTFLG
jgi:hypothetical protein